MLLLKGRYVQLLSASVHAPMVILRRGVNEQGKAVIAIVKLKFSLLNSNVNVGINTDIYVLCMPIIRVNKTKIL